MLVLVNLIEDIVESFRQCLSSSSTAFQDVPALAHISLFTGSFNQPYKNIVGPIIDQKRDGAQ